MEPIECVVTGQVRVLPPDPEFSILDDGELVVSGGRRKQLLQITTDRGRRTVTLADISIR